MNIIINLVDLIKSCVIGFISGSFTELAELFTKRTAMQGLRKENSPDKEKQLSQFSEELPQFYNGDIVHAINGRHSLIHKLVYPTGEPMNYNDLEPIKRTILVDLIEMKQRVDGQSYNLGQTIVKISSPETGTQYIDVTEADNLSYVAFIDEDSMLLTSCCDGKKSEWLITDNIEEFAMLSTIRQSTADYECSEDSEAYIFTCFNKHLGIMFTEIIPNIQNVELALDNVDKREPKPELLNGCYRYLNSMDAPLTEEQKQFLADHKPMEIVEKHIKYFTPDNVHVDSNVSSK